MRSKFVCVGILFLCVIFPAMSQIRSYDSLTLDQKFERLQFQVDSLKKITNQQSKIIEGLNGFQLDSLRKRVTKSEKEIMVTRYNLHKMHKQAQVANGFTVAGIACAVMGSIILSGGGNGNSTGPLVAGAALSLSGSIMAGIIGPIIRMDSFKHLGKAGKSYKIKARVDY